MAKRILLIQGHPDRDERHFCHALEEAYAHGARGAGHELKRVDVATLDFPLLRCQYEWEKGALPPALNEAQAAIKWAHHVVLFFPLWLGDMPALLKGFLEQVARPGFAFSRDVGKPAAQKGVPDRSARVVVTMAQPAATHGWFSRGHSVKSLDSNILGFVGIGPTQELLIGKAAEMSAEEAKDWLAKLHGLGRAAE